MKAFWYSILLFVILALVSCRNSDRNVSSDPIPVQKEGVSVPDTSSRKLIKEADLNFQTEDIEATAIQIRSMASAHKAYIAEENRFDYDMEKGYSMTIRVPAGDFDLFLQKILNECKIRKLNQKSIRVNDVTSEYIDVETRLKVKKETEAHYLELLKQSRTLEETIALESQLSDLRTEIESAEGRMKFLSNQVDYSTVRLSFTEEKAFSSRFFKEFWQGLKGGWQVFLKVIIGISYLWVLILLFFIGRFIYIRIRRSGRKDQR